MIAVLVFLPLSKDSDLELQISTFFVDLDFESTEEGVCPQSSVTNLRTLLSPLMVPLLPRHYFISALISLPQPMLPLLSPFGKYVTPVR